MRGVSGDQAHTPTRSTGRVRTLTASASSLASVWTCSSAAAQGGAAAAKCQRWGRR